MVNYKFKIKHAIHFTAIALVGLLSYNVQLFPQSVLHSSSEPQKVSVAGTKALLYLRYGDPSTWTTSNTPGSDSTEISMWENSGYTVTTMDLSKTQITDSLLSSYSVLRLNGSGNNTAITTSEGTAIYNWVNNGGRLLADIPFSDQVPAVSKFGVSSIQGQNGGSTGLDWYFNGAPLVISPVTGPNGTINTFACEAMDEPILSSGNSLTVDGSISGYPAIVHGDFYNGRVVIVFASAWSQDTTYPGNEYRAEIREGNNKQFLTNCINYLSTTPAVNTSLPFSDDFSGRAKPDWYIEGSHWSFNNGIASSNIPTAYVTEYMKVGNSNWSNYTLEADISATSGTDKTIGFRFQDINNYYQLHLIGPIAYHDIYISKIVNGSQIILYHDNNYTVLNNTNYHVKIIVNGNDFKFYINNALEADITDNTFSNGGIALVNNSGAYAPNDVQYDNISVNYLLPTTSTNTATNISNSSATLNGLVNANGTSSSVKFDYGTTTSYGSTVNATQSPVSGSGDTNVNAGVNGLAANTTYHFRVEATNSGGTSYGNDVTFKTLPYPPNVTTGLASSIIQTTATLNGVVNPNGTSTTVEFEYGTTSSYGSIVTASQSPINGSGNKDVSAGINGLAANTTYHYRVDATNGGGVTNGNDLTFKTLPYPPTNVTTGTASNLAQTTATLNGVVNPNGASTTVEFEYGTTSSYGNTVTASQSPVSGSGNIDVNVGIIGLVANTPYHYRVIATNNGGTSYGSDYTFTTLPDTPNVTTDSASNVTQTTATLYGIINPNGASTTVEFEYGTTTSYGNTVTASQSPVSGNTYTNVSADITGLIPNTIYHFKVKATNSGGTANGNDQIFYTSMETGDLSVTVYNVNNVARSGAKVMLYTSNDSLIDSKTTNSSGIALWTNIPAGNYNLEAYFTSTFWGEEFWANDVVNVIANATTGKSLKRNYPYVTGVVIKNDSTNAIITAGESIPAGTKVRAEVTVRNDVPVISLKSGVEFVFDINRSSPYEYYSGIDTMKTISSGGGTQLYTFTFIPRISGRYYYSLGVITTLNNSTNIVTDSWDWSQTFITSTDQPTAITRLASNVESSTATLNGAVNPNGLSTTVQFEYGTDATYGNTATALQSPVNGNSNVNVNANINGLTSNTLYHYRIKAVNSGGTSYGVDSTFKTLQVVSNKPIALTESVTNISQTTATLNGKVNPNGLSTAVKFAYGLTTSYGDTAITTPNPVSGNSNINVSANISNLTAGQTYHYELIATNIAGADTGCDSTFVTLPKTAEPTTITDAATKIGLTIATLNGTVNPNGLSTTVQFEYGTTKNYGNIIATTPSPVSGNNDVKVYANITGLVPDKIYHYVLIATNTAGSDTGYDSTFQTHSNKPVVTTNLALNVDTTTATLTGTVNPEGLSTTVQFEFGTTNGYGKIVTAKQSPINDSSDVNVTAAISSLTQNTLYHFRVEAFNSSDTSYGLDTTFKTMFYYPNSITLTQSYSFGDPTKSTSYKLIGLPGKLNTTLSQMFGGTAKQDWDAYYDNGNTSNYLVEYDNSSTFTFKPGNGFWIISKNPINISQSVNNVSLTADYYSIPLHAGWNIISNPFEKTVQWDSILSVNGLPGNSLIYSWNASWSTSTIFFPYEGYYFFNDSSSNIFSLKIPYEPNGVAGKKLSKILSLFNINGSQSLKLSLDSNNKEKSFVIINIDSTSSNNFDSKDILAPPSDFEDVGMDLFNKNLSISYKNLLKESRPKIGKGQTFNVQIKNTLNERANLEVTGQNNFEWYNIYFMDSLNHKFYNLKQQNCIPINPSTRIENYEVLIGNNQFIEAKKNELLPKDFRLSQNYPNPFNPTTTIEYSIPEGSYVTLRVYDITGRLIRTLVNKENAPGYYEVSFNGENLASGVYFYRLQAGTFILTKKLLLLK